MTSSPIYTKLYITKPRLVILILNNSTEVQFHNQYKRKLVKGGWVGQDGIGGLQQTKKQKNWILSKLLYVTRTHYNLYPPAVCEKNQILSLLLQGAYYFKNLHLQNLQRKTIAKQL